MKNPLVIEYVVSELPVGSWLVCGALGHMEVQEEREQDPTNSVRCEAESGEEYFLYDDDEILVTHHA